MSRCYVANMLQTSSSNQTYVLASCFKQYFPFLPGEENIHNYFIKSIARLNILLNPLLVLVALKIHRGYYTVARRYEFYVRVARTTSTSERSERVGYCSCHENKKFISSSQRVMFFLLYGETNSTKAKGGNRDAIERYDTHKGDIRKIRHSGPG